MRQARDGAGGILAVQDYEPYGGGLLALGAPLAHGYTGHPQSQATGLYRTFHRMYNTDTGRWLNRDPLGMADGPNMHGYVKGNPILFVDPDGGLAFAIPFIMGAGVGGAIGAIGQIARGCSAKNVAAAAAHNALWGGIAGGGAAIIGGFIPTVAAGTAGGMAAGFIAAGPVGAGAGGMLGGAGGAAGALGQGATTGALIGGAIGLGGEAGSLLTDKGKGCFLD